MRKLVVDDLVVEYVTDGYRVRALDGLSFEAQEGELVVLLGPSGSGKTTLLSCLAGILTPTSGSMTFAGKQIGSLRGQAITDHRQRGVGVVFQAFNLIPSLSALENVAAPLLVSGARRKEAMQRAEHLLKLVNMSERARHHPSKLSGGQQQRVAVARALAHDPPLLLADEPTANLDYVNAEGIIRLLRELRSSGRLLIVSSHDDRLIPVADRVVSMVPEAAAQATGSQKVEYTAGEVIFEQGTRGQLIYVIDSGSVDIIRRLSGGTDELLATLEPGQYFGELGPLLGFPRAAAARARTDAVLTAYGVVEFREKVLNPPAETATPAPPPRPARKSTPKKQAATKKKPTAKKQPTARKTASTRRKV